MKSCVIIYNQPGKNALPDELDVLDQVEFISTTLLGLGIESERKGITVEFMKEVEELAAGKPEFIFNLVESLDNKGELCYFVPALLNMYSIPYTGNPVEAMFLTTSKALTSRILKIAGISNPGSFAPSQIKRLVPGKQYIIKPVWEDGSMGITADSVFTFSKEYEEKLKVYDDSHWHIEEFIDGREFNISVIAGDNGPEVLPPAEMTFRDYGDDRPKIVDFKAKWIESSFEFVNTVRSFPGDELNPVLKERIEKVALRCWEIFGLRGYARVDMRVDKNDMPFVIEVNANPCLSPDGGLVAAVKASGIPFSEIVRRIINDINK